MHRKNTGYIANYDRKRINSWRMFLVPGIIILLFCVVLCGCTPKCAAEHCNEICLEGSEYCEIHTCHWEDCTKLVKEGTEYCTNHLCKEKDCLQPKESGGQYCDKHTCGKPGCLNRIMDGTDFCKEHQPCETCGGTGKVECNSCDGSGIKYVECSSCSGDGEILTSLEWEAERHNGGPYYIVMDGRKFHTSLYVYECEACKGTGKDKSNCTTCHGQGKITCSTCGGDGLQKE